MNLGEVALGLFGDVLKNASPAFKEAMGQTYEILYGEAKKTDSPWDDVAVGFLGGILGVKTPVAAPEPSEAERAAALDNLPGV